MADERKRIAVIGCGVAGLTAAHILQRQHDVTIFERNDRLGGHTNTVTVSGGSDDGARVDTGFIVCNDRTYPLFHRLLDQLGVAVRASEMSFSYHDRTTGFHYAGTGLNGLFAQRRNLLRPAFLKMLCEVARFCRDGRRRLAADSVPCLSIDQYVERGHYSAGFRNWYLAPMVAAIWSTPPGEVGAFPAEALLRFFKNHGLLALKNRPQWQTVAGGSHAYVEAFQRQFKGVVRRGCPVGHLRRTADGVRVGVGEAEESFDRAVVATHADQALALLADPDDDERKLLAAWHYQPNDILLHTDTSVLPPTRRAWASWNYCREAAADQAAAVSVSYSMSRLQGLRTRRHYCLSLNRRTPVAADSVVRELSYMHPTYTFVSMATQAQLPELNGKNHTYFCGSYFGYGFHEDAVRAGVAVGRCMGLEL